MTSRFLTEVRHAALGLPLSHWHRPHGFFHVPREHARGFLVGTPRYCIAGTLSTEMPSGPDKTISRIAFVFSGRGLPVPGRRLQASLSEEARAYHRRREASRREQFKIFTLALFAGLRFNEIDKLLWRQVNFDRAAITIEATDHFRPKTEEAAGEVPIDPELVAMLRGWKAKASGEFVIEPGREARPGARWNAYPSRNHQKALLDWLRALEIDGETSLKDVQKPIYELRKEAGSLINERSGIHAASVFLRHSDTRITSAHYLDARRGITTGFGALLSGGTVAQFPREGEKAESAG